jgi:hypothetical protein
VSCRSEFDLPRGSKAASGNEAGILAHDCDTAKEGVLTAAKVHFLGWGKDVTIDAG